MAIFRLIGGYELGGSYFYTFLIIIVTSLIHPTIYQVRDTRIPAAVQRRSRFFWALSFWDVGQARKVLSDVPNPIPPGAIIVDLAFMTGFITVSVYVGLTVEGVTAIFIILLFANSAIQWGLRLTLLVYRHLRWYVSTFKYHIDQTSRVKLLRFISTWLQANFLTQFFFLMATCCLVLWGRALSINVEIFRRSVEKGQLSWSDVFYFTLGIILLCIPPVPLITVMVWGTVFVIQDTRRRIQWLYERDSAVSEEVDRTPRSIQLV